jgi:transposase
MLTPNGQYRIFVFSKPLDFRCGMDRIAHICKSELAMNPYGGAVFLFFNRARDRAKVFFHDGSGPLLILKRLDRGRFRLPSLAPGATHATIASSELSLLLEGVDVTEIPRPKPRREPKIFAKEKKDSGLALTEPVAP